MILLARQVSNCSLELYSAIAALNELLQSKSGLDTHVRVLIGFDEIQNVYPDNSTEYLPFRASLSRVLALIERYQKVVLQRYNDEHGSVMEWRLYFPLLSTQSRLSELTAKEIMDDSDRGLKITRTKMPLFLAFPFDVFLSDDNFTPVSQIITLNHCASLSNTKRMGRPM